MIPAILHTTAAVSICQILSYQIPTAVLVQGRCQEMDHLWLGQPMKTRLPALRFLTQNSTQPARKWLRATMKKRSGCLRRSIVVIQVQTGRGMLSPELQSATKWLRRVASSTFSIATFDHHYARVMIYI